MERRGQSFLAVDYLLLPYISIFLETENSVSLHIHLSEAQMYLGRRKHTIEKTDMESNRNIPEWHHTVHHTPSLLLPPPISVSSSCQETPHQ